MKRAPNAGADVGQDVFRFPSVLPPLMWSDPATKAADVCFLHANMEGNLFGNCGITGTGDYIKCALA